MALKDTMPPRCNLPLGRDQDGRLVESVKHWGFFDRIGVAAACGLLLAGALTPVPASADTQLGVAVACRHVNVVDAVALQQVRIHADVDLLQRERLARPQALEIFKPADRPQPDERRRRGPPVLRTVGRASASESWSCPR